VDRSLDAVVANNVSIGRTCCDLLEGHIGKATLAFVQGIDSVSLFLIQLRSKSKVLVLLLFAPLPYQRGKQHLMELAIQLTASCFSQTRNHLPIRSTMPDHERMLLAIFLSPKWEETVDSRTPGPAG
jgi:hypothetical protein